MNTMKAAKPGALIDLTAYLPAAEESGLDYFTAYACRRKPPEGPSLWRWSCWISR